MGYATAERASDSLFCVAAYNGTILAFYYGAPLPDPRKILLGSGKQN